MSKKRRNHLPEFKSKVALAAIKGDQTLSECSNQQKADAKIFTTRGKRPKAVNFYSDAGNLSCIEVSSIYEYQ